jgi:tricorn protease
VAYVSDETGQYELYVRPAEAGGTPRQLTHNSAVRMFNPSWSPDSKHIAILDRTSTFYIVDVEGGKRTKVATDPVGSFNNWGIRGNLGMAWAPDSRWLAYAVCDVKSANSVIHIYELATGQDHAVTAAAFGNGDPAFDKSGDYLYFTSSQGLSPVYSDVDDYDTYFFANSTRLAYLPLRKDVKSPFLPRNDEEEVKPEGAAPPDQQPQEQPDGKPGEKPADKPVAGADNAAGSGQQPKDTPGDAATDKAGKEAGKDQPKLLTIDFDGIIGRARPLPIENGNYGNLQAAGKKLFFMRYPRTGAGHDSPALLAFDMERAAAQDPKQPAEQQVVPEVAGYQLTPDGKQLMLFANGALFVVPAAPEQKLEKPVPPQKLLKRIDPRHEWHQMILEDYRLFKEKFYDPNMHGVDWDAARDRALAKLPYAGCSEDVGFIISELNGEVNVGHSFVNPAASGQGPAGSIGDLGCEFERASDAAGHPGIRIGHVYRGAQWELDASGPLDEPGAEVHSGLAICAPDRQGRPDGAAYRRQQRSARWFHARRPRPGAAAGCRVAASGLGGGQPALCL